MAFDFVILIRQTSSANPNGYKRGDIVCLYDISKAPGVGATITPVHAIIVVRDCTVAGATIRKAAERLAKSNCLVDDIVDGPTIQLNKRRFYIDWANVPLAYRNALRDTGRIEVTWVQIKPYLRRKVQGVIQDRAFDDEDLG